MVLENSSTSQDISMKDNGKTTWLMEEARPSMMIKVNTMENSWTIKGMELEFSCKINAFSKENLPIISCKERQPCKMRMDRLIQANGKIMKNMVKENIVGLMEIDM